MYCAVRNCINSKEISESIDKKLLRNNIQFFPFPKKVVPQLKWKWTCDRSKGDIFDLEKAVICSLHFRPTELPKPGEELAADIIPTLNCRLFQNKPSRMKNVSRRMMYCAVRNCIHSKDISGSIEKKMSRNNIRFFPFPERTDLKLKWKWTCNLSKGEIIDLEKALICSLHFRATELPKLGEEIAANVIPTLNCRLLPSHPKTKTVEEPKYSVKIQDQLKEISLLKNALHIKDKLKDVEKHKLIVEIEKNKSKTLLISSRNEQLCYQISELNQKCQVQEETIEVLRKSSELQKTEIRDLRNYNLAQANKAKTFQPEHERLQKLNLSLYKQIQRNRSKVSAIENKKLEEENFKIMSENNNLRKAIKVCSDELAVVKKFFSPTQLYLLRFRNRSNYKCTWNKNEASKAISLYDCSSTVYKLLLSQGYPLPSMKTIMKWKQKLMSQTHQCNGIEESGQYPDSTHDDDLEYQPRTKIFKVDNDPEVILSDGFLVESTEEVLDQKPDLESLKIECEVEFSENSNSLEFKDDKDIKPDIKELEANSITRDR